MGEKQGLVVSVSRPFEIGSLVVEYIPMNKGYVSRKLGTSTFNLAKMFDRDYVVYIEKGPEELIGKTFYDEASFFNFLAEYFGTKQAKRPSWSSYFFRIAKVVATRSTCLRRQVGAVAVSPVHRRILATGYNGAPKGCYHCLEAGCLRQERKIPSGEREELCRAVHAEANLVAQSALHGISLKGAHVYCLVKPCLSCLKLLINSGVNKVFYIKDYPVDERLYNELVDQSGIILEQVKEEDDEASSPSAEKN